MKSNIFLLLLCFAVLLSCSNRNNKEQTGISHSKNSTIIHIDKANIRSIKASELFDDIRYIKLESSGEQVLTSVDKLIITNDNFYILDNERSKAVFVYDSNGELVTEIYKQGNGPTEYLFPQDFNVLNDTIQILDSKGKILSYDLQGNFLKSIELEFNTSKYLVLKNDEYLFFSPKSSNTNFGDNLTYRFVTYLPAEKTIVGLVHEDETDVTKKVFYDERNIFSQNGDQILFSETFTDTIFLFQEEKLSPRVILNFGDIKFPDSFFNKKFNTPLDQILAFNKTKGAFHTPNLFFNEQMIYTEFRYDKVIGVYHFIKEHRTIIAEHLLNDLDMGVSDMEIVGLYKEYMIATVPAHKMAQRLDAIEAKTSISKINHQKMLAFIDCAKSLDEYDPPVLVLLHLRNNN